ncbi:eukaryotic translation initiation factor 2 subunit alpha [Thecamonas trahens ATCC 50062]|uniref:Eukaryotic translation initiation factor 2 subunit alpha n=1 Tax=Thecamonas trahens ATCC 50062 TaxID=461836 RepID=A0A0L0DB15_THETB|nr:eukaryotic translation initiation factor 2 subunit alpha [Thecamonas trahens ATCC 50062]KNC48488.1 eukaryotic translation initiation factor 2 subunit alpha [Thecamonas trahens ATCC 50062]|eukprot:XP_013758600.1 eukaryotic translation initiation factor 2 subunit alpha [Thecamonas trahens ATCC 50062]
MSSGAPSDPLSCRMYEKKFPDIDEPVMVNVRSVAEMGAYVALLEYNNIEGMILLSELSKRRIRSIPKLIRVGRNEVVAVLRVDKEKGYIDLSKRRVEEKDIAQLEEKYAKSKEVHTIMRQTAKVTGKVLEDLYVQFGWPLYKKYGHAYIGFCKAIQNEEEVFGEFDIEPEVYETLMKMIRRRLTPSAVRLRADVEVSCDTYEGIEAIKRALRAGEISAADLPSDGDDAAADDDGDADAQVSVKLVAPPLYVFLTTANNTDKGTALLNEAIARTKAVIEEAGGKMNLKIPPRATSERDEKDFTALLKDLERANAEVDGDDSADDEE